MNCLVHGRVANRGFSTQAQKAEEAWKVEEAQRAEEAQRVKEECQAEMV